MDYERVSWYCVDYGENADVPCVDVCVLMFAELEGQAQLRPQFSSYSVGNGERAGTHAHGCAPVRACLRSWNLQPRSCGLVSTTFPHRSRYTLPTQKTPSPRT